MGLKIASDVKGRSKKMITMETKLEIIKKYEEGMRIVTLANTYGRNQSTIGTINKNKEAIKAKNPRAFKAQNITKERLLIFWKSNANSWVMRTIFIEWINVCFGPAVKNYLEENNLPLKCLLILDNDPAHPPGLEDIIHPDFSFIKAALDSPNLDSERPNSLPDSKPCSGSTLANHYTSTGTHPGSTQTLTTPNFDGDERSDGLTATKSLTKSASDNIIDQAWEGVTHRTLNSAWKKLWPDAVAPRDFKGFGPENEPVVDAEEDVVEIVSLCKSMGLEVDEDDITELVDEHYEDLTTKELKELQAMQHDEFQAQFSLLQAHYNRNFSSVHGLRFSVILRSKLGLIA
ncbi:tigger transposable element-derived protein 1-like [Palaemon carinicauda]|uniref:tigger transposable element-derived protein 1-like n=1 Tax=Palaemon carinicauda TaxID=392227 RepID=UPI0035B57E63